MIVDLTGFSTGFCDRLRKLFFCVAIAEIQNDYTLKIREEPTKECPFLFYDLCDIDGFDLAKWQQADGVSALLMRVPNSYPNRYHAKQHCPKGVVLSEDVLLDKWLRAYQRIRLKPHLYKKLQDLGVAPDCLGVQIRMTDRITLRHRASCTHISDVGYAEKNLIEIIKKKKRKQGVSQVFLACDNLITKEHWMKRIQHLGMEVKIHHAKFNAAQLRQTSGEDFVIDLFGLASCGQVVGLLSSGVVRTAVWMNGGRKFCFASEEDCFSVRIRKRFRRYFLTQSSKG